MRRRTLLAAALGLKLIYGQTLPPEQKQKVDDAVPSKASAKPRRPRRLLVSNLVMRDGHPARGSSYATIPAANYAIGEMGRRTGAYEAVFSDDIEIFRRDRIKQFDAICFLNTAGVLFEDRELKKSLLAYIAGGKGFVGIHDAIATFVQYPKYDQWPPFDQAFQLQEANLRDHLHVLLSIDVEKTGFYPKHRILPVRMADKDFPVSWIRAYKKGRVFYSSLGHGAPVFWNAPVLEHFLAGIQYALGDLKADTQVSGL
jgi:hypothetical protein